MTDSKLLTLDQGARLLGLRTAETFARFARRHGIPLVKFGARVVRVRAEDVDRAIWAHREMAGEAHVDSARTASPKWQAEYAREMQATLAQARLNMNSALLSQQERARVEELKRNLEAITPVRHHGDGRCDPGARERTHSPTAAAGDIDPSGDSRGKNPRPRC